MKKKYLEQKFSIQYLEKSEEGPNVGRMKVVMFTNNVDPGKLNASISGMQTRLGDNSVPFIDAHDQTGSIIKTLLGRVFDVHNGEYEGREAKIGYIEFAKTQVGQEAELLYRSGIARDVSIGIYYYEEDIDDDGYVTKSELVELSGVLIGADKLAHIVQSAALDKPDIEKLVANYNDIKPKIKLYRELFMDEALFEALGIVKVGEEVEDAKTLKLALESKLSKLDEVVEEPENPIPTENQQSYVTLADVHNLFEEFKK